MKYHLLFNGLGAGNIGDEAMMQGFLSLFPLPEETSVEVWDDTAAVLKQFPPYYRYVDFRDENTCRRMCRDAETVLLIGNTPIMEKWGLDWPLRVLKSKLEFCHQNGIPCHAVGVGVDHLESEEAKSLFKKGFLSVKTWTVRSFRSRNNLIHLGVDPSCIRIASDVAWLMPRNNMKHDWARSFLQSLGVNTGDPIIGVNVVNEIWRGEVEIKRELASALDFLMEKSGCQVAFFCNETRNGEYFDFEAAQEVASLMKNNPFIIPNNYFTPQQMLSLISMCTMTISWRYHFSVLSCLAGVVPLAVLRGEKIIELVEDTGIEHFGGPEELRRDGVVGKVQKTSENLNALRTQLSLVSDIMQKRAEMNRTFLGCGDGVERLTPPKACNQLASVREIRSDKFKAFMNVMNMFSQRFGLRTFKNWSKVWEYPWLWYHALSKVNWLNRKVLDLGSELSPMPWFLASLGAEVTLVESDGRWIPQWERVRNETGLLVKWQIVTGEELPYEDETFDVLTSFSVIEHQRNKSLAIDEVARVLREGGIFAVSFDICEPKMGMTFPDWNGKALTMNEFEDLVWKHIAFDNGTGNLEWNLENIPEFIQWHLQSAPHHNYTVGAAILKKKDR